MEQLPNSNQISNSERLKHYLRELDKQQLAPNTINNFLTAYDAFNIFKGGKMDRITRVNRKTADPQLPFPRTKMFEQLKVSCSKVRALMHLMSYEGLKTSECEGLNLGDLIFNEESTSIRLTNRMRVRTIVLSSETEAAIFDWLEERLEIPADNPALFLNRYGKRLAQGGIDFLIHSYGHKNYLDISARKLRQSYFDSPLSNTRAAETNQTFIATPTQFCPPASDKPETCSIKVNPPTQNWM